MKLIFITSNNHKYQKLKEFLKENNINIDVDKQHFDFEEPRSESIEYISVRKVLDYYNLNPSEDLILTEDSGLFIPSLNNFPGTYTATIHKKIGLKGILKLMENNKDRKAYFKSCFSLLIPSPMEVKTFCGIVEGTISDSIKGNNGFGHDPVFIPKNHKKTFAEDYELKKKISHRVKAAEKLASFLKTLNISEKTKRP